MRLDPDQLRSSTLAVLLAPEFRRATFAAPTRASLPCPWVRVVVRPLLLRGEKQMQIVYSERKKQFTQNYPLSAAAEPLGQLLDYQFSGMHISTTVNSIDVRITKKGKVAIGYSDATAEVDLAPHNRIKDQPLPEGRPSRLLQVMGIQLPDGRIKAAMRDKFAQINAFLIQLSTALESWPAEQRPTPLRILDCGCGSSYLTLAAHHYLNDVLHIPATLVGIDVNDELIRKSLDRAQALEAGKLSFTTARIGQVDSPADIVLALHACDTATDDAIAQAIRSRASLFLGVPCCHHALNRQIAAAGDAEVLRPLLRHGIVRERTADLVTDAFRALTLRIMGYRTDVIEFVGDEHTPRNLMLRAIRGPAPADPEHLAEYRRMKQFWNVQPYIETAIGSPFLGWVAESG